MYQISVELQQQEKQQLELEDRARAAAIIRSRNSKERAKELANINKELDEGRAHSTKTILVKAMQK